MAGASSGASAGLPAVHAVVEHDPVDVVDDLGLVPELHRFPEPALRDRAGVRIVQATPAGSPIPGSSPPSRVRVWPITWVVRPRMISSSATAATSRPDACRPWRAMRRRALTSTRVASATVASVRSASSPVIRQHPGLGLVVAQLQVRRDRPGPPARRPAPVPHPGPAPPPPPRGSRATSMMISVIARTSSPESVG